MADCSRALERAEVRLRGFLAAAPPTVGWVAVACHCEVDWTAAQTDLAGRPRERLEPPGLMLSCEVAETP